MSVWDDAFRVVLEHGSEEVQRIPAKALYEIIHLVVPPGTDPFEVDPPQISEFDKEHIAEIVMGHGDWFGAQLIRLIAKADARNRNLLRQMYPNHVAAFDEWFES